MRAGALVAIKTPQDSMGVARTAGAGLYFGIPPSRVFFFS
jgi:hypothetical protein